MLLNAQSTAKVISGRTCSVTVAYTYSDGIVILIIIINNDAIYRTQNLVENDNSKRATRTTHTRIRTYMEQGMYNYVQKAGGNCGSKKPIAERG